MCPIVLGADKEVSPAVSGLCLIRSGKIILADVLKLTSGFDYHFLQVWVLSSWCLKKSSHETVVACF